VNLEFNRPLRALTTLAAGGNAEQYVFAGDLDTMAKAALEAQTEGITVTVLGWGSNVLVSDKGIGGLVIHNGARRITFQGGFGQSGTVIVETGAAFQDLFLKTAQASLHGFEYAVGIPGTVGGALVSNAGAYRSQISEFLKELEICEGGVRRWVDPSWMEFGYRDSKLRRSRDPGGALLLSARFELPTRKPWDIYAEARDYQRQRIFKQPPSASAGSFFKNVTDRELAQRLPTLPEPLREKGIIPAGYLLEAVGLKGYRRGPVAFGSRHANFILNLGGASATEIRRLAQHGQSRVYQAYGVKLEEEVLYIGDWSGVDWGAFKS
jgi:UDP-N-acetylmuramate dehydrogenase